MKKSTKTTKPTAKQSKGAKISAATKGPAKAVTKPKAERKPAAGDKPKRRSALDAAAEVLRKAGKPLRTREMITAMAEQGLWSSPNGKTPAATLYSALLREIQQKGSETRFKKTDRGQFEYAGGGR